MYHYVRRGGAVLKKAFEAVWQYLGSLAAVCVFASVLGLGIYHAVVKDTQPAYYCYAGVVNPAGAEPPRGITLLGQGAEPAVSHVRMEYTPEGRVRRMCHVDAEGRLSALPGSQVAEQLLTYNAAGRLLRKESRNAAGKLTEDAQGVAVREFDYDRNNRLVQSAFRNARGELVAPRFPGYAVCRVAYDEHDRPLELRFLDADGKPGRNAQGEECVEYEYGEDGSMIRRNLVGGALKNNYYGVARECLEPLPEGNGSRRCWFDEAGRPAVHPEVGAAVLQHEPQVAEGLQRRRFLGANGAPYLMKRTCAEHLVRSNRSGKPEWECFGAADGLPVNHPALGYAERVCEYADDGALLREYFWDAEGLPAPVSERRHVGTHAGVYTLSLLSDGSTVVQPE